MQFKQKNLLLSALVAVMGFAIVTSTGCDDTPTTDNDGAETVDVTGTWWKKSDKAAFGNAANVTQVVISGKHTYVATDDKGLFVSDGKGGWKAVDLTKGIAPAAAAGSPAIPLATATNKKIKHLTALNGDRVIFVVANGTSTQGNIVVAEGDVAKRTWATAGGAAPATTAHQISSILVVKNAAGEERILLVDGQAAAKIYAQFDTADASLTVAWNDTLQAAGAIFNVAMTQLSLNHDGSAVVFSKDASFGYDRIAVANLVNGGAAANNPAGLSFVSRNDPVAVVWRHNNLPTQLIQTGANTAVFRLLNTLAFASDLTAAAAANVAITPWGTGTAPTAVYKLVKDGANVKALTNEGIFTVKGTDGTEVANSKFVGDFTGDNFVDESKSDADLAAIKKSELPAFTSFGSKDIKDMDANAKVTAYVTGKNEVFVGTKATRKLKK